MDNYEVNAKRRERMSVPKKVKNVFILNSKGREQIQRPMVKDRYIELAKTILKKKSFLIFSLVIFFANGKTIAINKLPQQ